jgi:hypothetical protein
MGRLHVAETHYVTEIIFGKTGNEKQKEGNEETAVFQEVIVLFNNRGLYNPLHKGQSKEPGKREGYPGADSKTNGGINRTQKSAVNIPADKTGDFTGYRGCYHLQDLKANEDNFIIRMEGVNERDSSALTREVYIEVIMDK